MTDTNTAAYLSQKIYENLVESSTFGPSGRFYVSAVEDNIASGYYGAIIHDTLTGEGILVSRGTQPTSTNDLIADLDLVFGGGGGSQFIAAKEFLEVYNSSSGIPGFVPVSVSTGHSLGGYLAQTMGIAFNLDVVSIGSPGAQAALNNLEILGYGSAVANYDYGNKMTNITNEYDPVGNYGQNIVGSNQVIVNVDDYVSTTLQGRIAAKITQTSHALGLINGQPYDISLGAQWGYQFVQETQKLLHYHSIGNYYSAINQDSFSIANPNLNINFDALTSNLSLYEIVDQNTLNYRLYNNNSISKALSSLSVSSSVLDIYLSSGWSALGSQNSYLDNYDINFGDSRWTAIAENSLLTLNTVPSYNFGFWGAVQAGDYVVNNTISGWNGKLLTYQNFVSPLTFDLDNDGIESNHIYSQNVYFDIDGDGYAEKVGWIGPDDGQLAYDANQDGVINDITELFGDDIMPAFQKLALFDSNRDGKISNLDDAYDDLLVWRDLDQDGFSDEGELLSLYDTGIKEISLAETPMDEYQNENYFSGKATYTRLDNSTGDIVDVHFLNDNVNTWFMGAQSEVYGSTYQINPEALLLPLSRGYGSLASLHIAMTNNEDLRTMMRELVTLDTADFDQISSKITAFLYEWAGVTDNDPEARATGNGSNIDARKVDFIEKFTGVEWKQMGVTEMVGDKASIGVKKIWAEIANFMTARILVQGTLYEEIFQNSSYDFKTDTLTLGDTMTEIISRAQNYISAFPAQEREFWLSIGNILVIHRDELDVDISDITTALDAAYGAPLYIDAKILTSVDGEIYSAIDSGDELITTNVLVGDNNDNVITGSNANDYIFGNGGADTLEGRDGDDFLRGDDGADILYGGDGDDRLEGKGGDDILEGGVGRDDIRGGDGADTLIGGAGQDKLHGGAGADIIDGGAGNDEIDYLESNQGVYVNLKTREAEGGHATGDTYINIENITGSDFADILIGDDADNVINGESGDDIIYGGAGNDALFGASGDDRLYGEEGNDTFDGFSGKEYMDGGEGQDTVNYTHPYNTSGVYANLELAKGFVGAAEGDIYVSIENLTGSEHDDVLVGNNENNIIRGDDGNDIIIGGGGNDILDGGAGYNQLIGGAGDDRFIINPSDVDITWIIDFNPADDVLDYSRFTSNITTSTTIDVAAIGSDTLLSIDGKHLVILKGIQPNELYFSNFQVHATDSTLVDIDVYENIDAGVAQQGDTHGNKLWGTLFSDTINGEGGDDNINALEGDDTLSGGDGNDRFVGGHGSDDIDGGAGVDTIDFRDSYEGVTVNLTNGTGSGGTAEGDTYSSIESVEGSVFDDVIIGNSENNLLSGNVGNDTIHAKGGTNNILIGGAGNDTFIIDQIYGADLPDNGLTALRNNGNGTFTAIGGTPNSITYIYDFEAGNPDEKIDLSSFTISEMYIVRLDDVEVNEEVISGAAVHIFDGTESQLIILKGTSYEDLIEDNFVLPSSFDFADVEWQVIGSDEDDLLLGSTNNDTIFAFEGFDITLDHRGNDVVYGNSFKAGLNDLSLQMTAQQIDDLRDVQVFKITKNSDDTDVIFNFDSYAYTNNFFLYGPFVTITPTAGALDWDNSYSPNGPYTVGATFQLNSILDFTDFADVRNGNDLLIQLVDTNSDSIADATVINLPNNQSVILAGFVNLSLEAWQWVGGGYGTHALPDGSGGWINYNGWLAEALFDVLAAENFLFYDGTLIGTNSADILEGGYGVDEIIGGDGNDYLTGEADNDELFGGAGYDTLAGGAGDDILTGGDQADLFIIEKETSAEDIITDFEYWRPEERIDLSAFDGDFVDFADFKQAFTQVGDDVHISLGDGQKLILENIAIEKLSYLNFVGNVGINNAPVAKDDAFSGNEDAAITGNVLSDNGEGADSDVDSDSLSVIPGSIITEKGGLVVISANGAFSYTPLNDFNGVDKFFYTVIDNNGGIDIGQATLTIAPVNDAPVIINNGIATFEDFSITLTTAMLRVVDPDNDNSSLVFTVSAVAQHGSLTLNGIGLEANDTFTLQDIIDGRVSYASDENYNGSDSFDFSVSDGIVNSSSNNAIITIGARNDAPVITNEGTEITENQSVIFTTSMLNVTDIDNTAAQIIFTITAVPAHGTLKLDGISLAADDTFTMQDLINGDISYTPVTNYTGVDSFNFEVSDGTAIFVVNTFDLLINPANTEPSITNNGGTTDEDTPLVLTTAMLNASDLEQSASQLAFTVDNLPAHGTLKLDGVTLDAEDTFTLQDIINGDVTYSSSANYNGADSFDFTLSDGIIALASDTFDITIDAVNDAPSLTNNGGTTGEDTTLVLTTAMLNASDPEQSASQLIFIIDSLPAHGSIKLDGVTLSADDTFTLQDIINGDVTYNPASAYEGSDSFDFSMSDGVATLSSDTFEIEVEPLIINGTSGNDTLVGTSSSEVINGLDGNDIIEGGAGNDTMNGGNGIDTLRYSSAASAITINLATATAQNTGGAGTDTISGFENIIGSAYNDTLTGNGSANIIEGGAGNDTMNGAGGTDTLNYANASAGITINLATTTAQNTGGAGIDTISNFENVIGSAYNDTLTGTSAANIIEGGAGNDTMNAAGGTDTLTYANASGGITVSLASTSAQDTGSAGTDTISNFENLTGSAYNDTLTGSSAANIINGGAGNDTINAGDGNDTIDGGAGDDVINGAGGTDTLTYANASSGVTVSLATTSAQNTGGYGTDTISNVERLTGSAYADTLTGSSSANILTGGDGNDTLVGGGGNDTLNGDAGNDTLQGGAGTDTLNGGAGTNTLTGGTSNDTFVIANGTGNSNTITDFALTELIDLSAFNSRYTSFEGLQADMAQIGANTSIDLGNSQTLVLNGITKTSLTADHFTGNAGNSRPVITKNSGSTNEDTTLVLTTGILNATDADNAAGQLIFTVGSLPTHGAIKLSGVILAVSNTFTMQDVIDGNVSYVPAENYNGSDGFNFTLSDGIAILSSTAFGITVNAINDAPDITNIGGETDQNTPMILTTMMLNAADLEQSATQLIFEVSSTPTQGTLKLDNVTLSENDTFTLQDIIDGDVSYVPDSGYYGTDSFDFTLSDGTALSSEDTFEITVNFDNDDPLAEDDNFTGYKNLPVSGNLLLDNGNGVDTDPDSDPLSIQAGTFSSTQGGTVTIWANGNFSYLASSNFTGSDTFSYTLDDGKGGTSNGIATISVQNLSATITLTNGNDIGQATSGNDIIFLLDGDDLYNGHIGSDIILGGNGNDNIRGGLGQAGNNGDSGDWIFGEADDDDLTGEEAADHLYGGAGNDDLTGEEDFDVLDGGDGIDTAEYGTSTARVVVDLTLGKAIEDGFGSQDLLINIENVYGSNYDDIIYGDSNTNSLFGGDGEDILYGGSGYDSLHGGSGDDTFIFKSGDTGVDLVSGIWQWGSSDKIDISDLLSDYDPLADAITDYVEISDAGWDSILKVDKDGAGSNHSMVQIATLQSVTGMTDEAALVTNGKLIVV